MRCLGSTDKLCAASRTQQGPPRLLQQEGPRRRPPDLHGPRKTAGAAGPAAAEGRRTQPSTDNGLGAAPGTGTCAPAAGPSLWRSRDEGTSGRENPACRRGRSTLCGAALARLERAGCGSAMRRLCGAWRALQVHQHARQALNRGGTRSSPSLSGFREAHLWTPATRQ